MHSLFLRTLTTSSICLPRTAELYGSVLVAVMVWPELRGAVVGVVRLGVSVGGYINTLSEFNSRYSYEG